jgi:DNA-binding transcriptional MerR regulator
VSVARLPVTRETRWVELDEAAALAGVPPSTLRRWYRNGRIESMVGGAEGTRRLVALDDVLLARAAQVAASGRNGDAASDDLDLLLDPWQRAVVGLCGLAHERGQAAARERRRAETAEAEVAALRAQMSDLESWIEERARYEDVEQIQLGRLLARASSEREARAVPFIASPRFAGAIVYTLAMALLIWLLLTDRV